MSGATVEIRVGLGSCGIASGAEPVWSTLQAAAVESGANGILKSVGCKGMCHREPLVEVVDEHGSTHLYGGVTAETARHIAHRHLHPRAPVRRTSWMLQDAWARLRGDTPDPVGSAPETLAYTGKQQRIVLEHCGSIDPGRLQDYQERQGYQALRQCVEQHTPEQVVDLILASGLRGRGGAGFPTGRKWSLALAQPGPDKYVICNGDEGDPGAFMDRMVLESDPHRVLEGLAIAAYAVGAKEGFLYIRAEYPQAVRHIHRAIAQAEEAGFLGSNLFGSDFSLKLSVREGAGAFVCGEETALIASLEGRRGMPRLRPPFPIERGLHDKPTIINNVETLASVPWILRHGAEAFAALGSEKSKGTKVFALAGKVRRGGLIEVPMGITLREVVEDIGGGIQEGRRFKAVQIGGPSGGCLPADMADTPVDYEALARTGTIMGSGGLVVLDETDCMVDVARFFLGFTQAESCGKCTFCRIGTKRMLEILERLCEGRAVPEDLVALEELADRVKRASLCGLGQTAPNPVLTTLRYFREEYEAHLNEKRCPAGSCPSLIHYRVLENCTGCTLCAQVCPTKAIEYLPHQRHFVQDDLCTRCGMCVTACQDDAIEVA